MSTGERVKQARKAAKMSQAALGARVGLTQPTIADLERGKSAGSTQIASIAAALKVNPLWLETGRGSMDFVPVTAATLTDEEVALVEAYRRGTDADRAALNAVASAVRLRTTQT